MMKAMPAQGRRESKPRPKNTLLKTIRGCVADWQLYTLLLPAFLYTVIFAYIPMYGVIIAFKNFQTGLGIWGSEWVGIKHFIRFINFPNFWLIVRNTAQLGFYSFATFPCSVILALLINELTNRKFKKAVQMITYAPYFLSTVVVCSLILLFLNANSGVINNIRAALGMERVDYITIAADFDNIYVWSGVWQGIGWGTIIYLAALSGVSPELVEAARMDGATRYHIIRHVNIPSIMPTIIIVLILSCGGILSVGFEKVYLLQNSLNLSRSQVISTYVYQIGIIGKDSYPQYSYASAIGLFNNVINIAILIVANMIAKKASDISIW